MREVTRVGLMRPQIRPPLRSVRLQPALCESRGMFGKKIRKVIMCELSQQRRRASGIKCFRTFAIIVLLPSRGKEQWDSTDQEIPSKRRPLFQSRRLTPLCPGKRAREAEHGDQTSSASPRLQRDRRVEEKDRGRVSGEAVGPFTKRALDAFSTPGLRLRPAGELWRRGGRRRRRRHGGEQESNRKSSIVGKSKAIIRL